MLVSRTYFFTGLKNKEKTKAIYRVRCYLLGTIDWFAYYFTICSSSWGKKMKISLISSSVGLAKISMHSTIIV